MMRSVHEGCHVMRSVHEGCHVICFVAGCNAGKRACLLIIL